MLASVLPDYGKFPFDRTFEATRNDIGGQLDLANPEHAKQLRIWLNQWLCRIGYPGLRDEVFVDSLASWWRSFKDKLQPQSDSLVRMGRRSGEASATLLAERDGLGSTGALVDEVLARRAARKASDG